MIIDPALTNSTLYAFVLLSHNQRCRNCNQLKLIDEKRNLPEVKRNRFEENPQSLRTSCTLSGGLLPPLFGVIQRPDPSCLISPCGVTQ